MSRTSSDRRGDSGAVTSSKGAGNAKPRRIGRGTASAIVAAVLALFAAPAMAETRALTIRHTHTGETATIVFKRDGVYDQEGLSKLNYILRDWRQNQVIKMDPHLFDLVWEVYRESGTTAPIEVVCGYRTNGTNNMLRSRSRSTGVAKFSQHTLGKALDFYLPGVNLEHLREIGMRKQIGGVGFYPTSGSPFVHMDTGNVRAWPRMTREQLVRLFPDGKTLHQPADGGPLPRYQEAVAEYQRRHAGQTQIAGVGEPDTRPGGLVAPKGNFITALFGGPKPAEEDEEETAPAKAPEPTKPVVLARAPEPQQAPAPVLAAAPPPKPALASFAPRLAPHAPDEAPADAQPRTMVVASLPEPPAGRSLQATEQTAEPARAPGAILPAGWTAGPQPAPPATAPSSRLALKPVSVPLPLDKPQFAIVPTPRPKPPATAVASIDPHGGIDDAFSALTGTPRDDKSAVLLGYAPVASLPDVAADPRTTTSVARDHTTGTGVRMAALAPPQLPPEALKAGRSLAVLDPVPAPSAAPKGNRADPMTRMISHVSDQVEAGLLDAAGADRARTMSKLQHPDLDSVHQLIVKPAEMLATGFNPAPSLPTTPRFSGPAVVALAVLSLR